MVLVEVEARGHQLPHRLPHPMVEVEVEPNPTQKGKYFYSYSRSYNYRVRQREKAKEFEKARKKSDFCSTLNEAPTSPITKKSTGLYTSFVRRRSSMICKMLPKNPQCVLAVLKHVWDQEYKNIEKKKLMDKYWKRKCFLRLAKAGHVKMRQNCLY